MDDITSPHGGVKVLLDGVDTALLGLQQLRRSITIVPQVQCCLVVLNQSTIHICLNQKDSVIFSGSLGFNLDPWQTVEEEELKSVLQRIGVRQSKVCHSTLHDNLNSVVQRKTMNMNMITRLSTADFWPL